MNVDISEILKRKAALEEEKILFGGEVYLNRHILPPITIDMDNNEDYRGYVSSIKHIAEQFGADCCHLFAELCYLYKIMDEEDLKHPLKLPIQQIGSHILGKISLAILQTNKIQEILLENEEYELSGEDYCFIIIMLQDLFNTYCYMVAFLQRKQYLNDALRESIRERLMFLISGSFEELREMFLVAQSYDIIEKRMEEGKMNTIH